MRKGFNSGLLLGTNSTGSNNLVGINLGADYCAEHEFGIATLQGLFKVNNDVNILGINRRKINTVPDKLIFKEININNKIYYILLLKYFWDKNELEKNCEEWIPKDLLPNNDDDLICAWDERSFGIVVSEVYKEEINELYTAFLNKNIAIAIGASSGLKNGGLIFLIISKLSSEYIDNIYKTDKDYLNLQKAAKAIGIYEILKKAKKEWLALIPKWKDDNKKEIIFWLNPKNQTMYKFGWYTVEDLKDWTEDKGEIIIK